MSVRHADIGMAAIPQPPIVTIVRTGIANTASVAAAMDRAGCVAHLTADPSAIERSERLVLPGVGAFGTGMSHLREMGIDTIVRERVAAGRATLAICLGLQLLFESSEESPGVRGLGVLPGHARRFPRGVATPQFGWNRVVPDDRFTLAGGGFAYFANSYRLKDAPDGWSCLWCEHGGAFVAALSRGPVLACQFHPELSGSWGHGLLRRWIETSADDSIERRDGAAQC